MKKAILILLVLALAICLMGASGGNVKRCPKFVNYIGGLPKCCPRGVECYVNPAPPPGPAPLPSNPCHPGYFCLH